MPVYVYECMKCGWIEEDIESINSPSVERACTREKPLEDGDMYRVCDGKMRRVPQAGSFRFDCPMPTYQKPKT